MTSNPWIDICAASSGMLLWGCHFMLWAHAIISAAALLLSVTASMLAVLRMLRAEKERHADSVRDDD